ncbi:hypothetical protein ABIB37_000801 [Agrococcus sp. UYP10]|uniref:hypothetical protein n=1 Tax=Agrococcus sp. UYP10 TaxID=1756355 RepID=UPI003391C5C2
MFEKEIRSAIASIRAQLEVIEMQLGHEDLAALEVFDPTEDEPPVPLNLEGTRHQRDWCALLLWARLKALNVREGRGATKAESTEIAQLAGYTDARGWNRWSGWVKDDENGRWVTSDGEKHLRHYYSAVGRRLPDDFLST